MKKHAHILILTAITLIYALTAFINLGNLTAPQTYLDVQEGDSIVLDLGEEQQISRLNLFLGRAEGRYYQKDDKSAENIYYQYSIELSNDGVNWTTSSNKPSHNAWEMFKWVVNKLDQPARYIRLTCLSEKQAEIASKSNYISDKTRFAELGEDYYAYDGYHQVMLNEVAVYGADKQLLPITNVTANIKEINHKTLKDEKFTGEALIDEQKEAQYEQNVYNSMYFDEVYHGRTAFEILHGLPIFETTHPTLGKVLMSIAVGIFGMVPFGWRFMGTLAGVLMLPAMYLLAWKLFSLISRHKEKPNRAKTLALIASSLLALDFMHFSLTRIATIDSYPVLFIILTFYFLACYAEKLSSHELTWKKRAMPLLWSGICFGLACATKWIGLYMAPGILAILIFLWVAEWKNSKNKIKSKELISKHFWTCALTFIALPALIYFGSYIPQMTYDLGGRTPVDYVVNYQKNMFNYHSGLTDATHPFSSAPTGWWYGQKPLFAYSADEAGSRSMVGNIWFNGTPIIWLLGFLGMIALMIRSTKKGWYWVAPLAFLIFAMLAYHNQSLAMVAEKAKNTAKASDYKIFATLLSMLSIASAALWAFKLDLTKKIPILLSFAFLSAYLPWLLVPRISFIYHYFASVPFIILALVYWLQYEHIVFVGKGKNKEPKLKWQTPKWLWFAIPALALCLFITFYPHLSGLEIPDKYSKTLFDIYNTLTFKAK